MARLRLVQLIPSCAFRILTAHRCAHEVCSNQGGVHRLGARFCVHAKAKAERVHHKGPQGISRWRDVGRARPRAKASGGLLRAATVAAATATACTRGHHHNHHRPATRRVAPRFGSGKRVARVFFIKTSVLYQWLPSYSKTAPFKPNPIRHRHPRPPPWPHDRATAAFLAPAVTGTTVRPDTLGSLPSSPTIASAPVG